MASWRAAQAKAKFSEVLDQAEEQGPQHIQRRKGRFVLVTEAQYAEHGKPGASEPFLNAWDAMRPSFSERYDVEFPRVQGGMRTVDLG